MPARSIPSFARKGTLISPPDAEGFLGAVPKRDHPEFRKLEYIGVDEIKIQGPTGRNYHFGEDPDKCEVLIHILDINYLKALGLIR